MAESDLLFQPVSVLAPLLQSRKVSPVELTQACLNQIGRLNPRLRAFLTVTPGPALRAARAAEQEIAAGNYRGPLHGIPYAPKDLFATQGIRTTNGSRVTAAWIPGYESTATARLRNAGAILTGKLNMLEFAMGSGQSGLNGPARNPWNPDYSPSGSSSGSGAAIAAGMVPFTLGTDSGGSIRGPAKSCGVVGLKPTYGRISLHGVTTLSWTLDHAGPLARTVADVALLLKALAGADPLDPSSSPEPVPDYSLALQRPVKGLRFGVPSEHFFTHVHRGTAAAIHSAIDVLESLGAIRVEVNVANAAMASVASGVILGAESAAFHHEHLTQHPDLLDPLVRERLEVSSLYAAVDYIKALRVRTVLIAEMRRVFEQCEVLVIPAGNAAPRLESEIARTDLPTDPPAPSRPDSLNLANVTGIPALVLPCGFTPGPAVLPLAIQFCARHFHESALFTLGHAYQSATDWHKRRPS